MHFFALVTEADATDGEVKSEKKSADAFFRNPLLSTVALLTDGKLSVGSKGQLRSNKECLKRRGGSDGTKEAK